MPRPALALAVKHLPEVGEDFASRADAILKAYDDAKLTLERVKLMAGILWDDVYECKNWSAAERMEAIEQAYRE